MSVPAFSLITSYSDLEQYRIIVAGGAPRTLDLLRLAAVRSDSVLLIGVGLDAEVRRVAALFGIEVRERPVVDTDIPDAAVLFVAVGDIEAENRIVRAARAHHRPVYVAGRDVVSDFQPLDLFDRNRSIPIAA